MTPKPEPPLDKEAIRSVIDEYIKDRIRNYRVITIAFLFGLGGFVIALATNLLDIREVIQDLHSRAFPVRADAGMLTAYSNEAQLRASDPRTETWAMTFYAERGQKVLLHLDLNHRFTGDGPKRRVLVYMDNVRRDSLVDNAATGFHDITESLTWSAGLTREENIHAIRFELDDTQPVILTDEVSIACIVHVRGPSIQ